MEVREPLTKEEYQIWLDHPVTIRFMKYLNYRKENFTSQYMGYTPHITTVGMMGHIKGAIEDTEQLLHPSFFEEINTFEESEDGKA